MHESLGRRDGEVASDPADDHRHYLGCLRHRDVAGAFDEMHLGVASALEDQGVRLRDEDVVGAAAAAAELAKTKRYQVQVNDKLRLVLTPIMDEGKEVVFLRYQRKTMLGSWEDQEWGRIRVDPKFVPNVATAMVRLAEVITNEVPVLPFAKIEEFIAWQSNIKGMRQTNRSGVTFDKAWIDK